MRVYEEDILLVIHSLMFLMAHALIFYNGPLAFLNLWVHYTIPLTSPGSYYDMISSTELGGDEWVSRASGDGGSSCGHPSMPVKGCTEPSCGRHFSLRQ